MKHTPGPWSAHKTYIFDEYGNKVAVACPAENIGQGNPKDNAILIAASPELLSACQSALDLLNNPEADTDEAIALQTILIAAIKKASE